MDIAPADSMIFEEPNLFIEETVTNVQRVTAVATTGTLHDASLFAGNFNSAGNTTVRYYPYYSPGTVIAAITDFDLYINNIFVNPEVHDIYIRRIGFTLIRVHLYANIATNETGEGERQLSQLKWPIEYIFLGIRPRWNITAANPKQWRDWHRLTKVNTGRYDTDAQSVRVVSTEGNADGSLRSASDYAKQAVVRSEYVSTENTVSSLRVTAHGVSLYEEYDASFYSTYLPYHYGGMNITSPEDPGTYQPSGHLNISRAREFNVAWKTPYVTPTSVADLVVVATAINFLLISDGSAVLRFST
jgi:hypothetical protein